jgi:hypothetical protein
LKKENHGAALGFFNFQFSIFNFANDSPATSRKHAAYEHSQHRQEPDIAH